MKLYVNEDFENFFANYPPEKMNQAGIDEQMAKYAAGGEKAVIFCGNGQKARFESEVFETMWNGLLQDAHGNWFYRGKTAQDSLLPVQANALGAMLLHKNVENPFQKRIDSARAHGMKGYLSMRMNDNHNVSRPDNLMVSDFWRNHQNALIAKYAFEDSGNEDNLRLNYADVEVFNHHLALAKEYVTRFDCDGFELDWMRGPTCLVPGEEDKKSEVLTNFMREVRATVRAAEKRTGHPIEFMVRLPSHPDDAIRLGFDVAKWAREGLVDRIIPTTFWGCSDFDIPLKLWRDLLGENVAVTAGLEIICRSNFGGCTRFFNPIEVVAGLAASHYYRGSDGIYLFNHMDNKELDHEELRRIFALAGDREKVENHARRHVVTYNDIKPLGLKNATILPLELDTQMRFVRINIGGRVKERNARLILGIEGNAPRKVWLNGVVCEKSLTPFLGAMPPDVKNLCCYDIDDRAIQEGDNIVAMTGSDGAKSVVMWCEIDLDAKN